MKLSSREMLRRLGAGERIAEVCAAAGLTRSEFGTWWRTESAARVPAMQGEKRARVRAAVRIDRDARGVPSIYADNDEDLFFGLGHAMAQDRLFQLDFLRRKGAGRLSEVLGPEGTELDYLWRLTGLRNVLEWDLLARTVGLRRIAQREWQRLPIDTRRVLTAFTAGVNALIEDTRDAVPIEFDLLDYRPEPWSEVDCLTIESEFRWYLSGRFPVIVIPELARRALGDGPLYRAFLSVESDSASILPHGSYSRTKTSPTPVGAAMNDPQGGEGSNNWVLAGARTTTGKPLVASDPHIAFEAVSCWYEAHLCGGSIHAVGMAYAGMPAIMFGRTQRVAWGCTNNILSQRDLYQEKVDPQHPGCFLFDGRWEAARRLQEVVTVKGGSLVRKDVVFSHNGPIVDEILPPVARTTGPVSLKWLGAHEGGWLTALLAMDRAGSAAELREAMRPWHVPAFSVVYGDVEGHVGYQAAGRVPVRGVWERGYRPGWEPRHQWQGLILFEEMPHWVDPPRGWVATANNRVAPDDYPWPLSGCWSTGLRAERIHELIETKRKLSPEDCGAMQQDALSVRARRCMPALLTILRASGGQFREAESLLASWDCVVATASPAATIFNVFFARWTQAVAAERFAADLVSFLGEGAAGLAAALLNQDEVGWFAPGRREQAIREAFAGALDYLAGRLGPDMRQWGWGRLHVVPLRHFLSGRADLGNLLDHGGMPVHGDLHTVCSTGANASFEGRTGAGYRLIADLSTSPPELRAVDGQGQSGHPGSPHYTDQSTEWARGHYFRLPLDRTAAQAAAVGTLVLEPG